MCSGKHFHGRQQLFQKINGNILFASQGATEGLRGAIEGASDGGSGGGSDGGSGGASDGGNVVRW